jgi:hypothetical protein
MSLILQILQNNGNFVLLLLFLQHYDKMWFHSIDFLLRLASSCNFIPTFKIYLLAHIFGKVLFQNDEESNRQGYHNI